MMPIASLYATIPVAGALIALFTVEQLVNGWQTLSAYADEARVHRRCKTQPALSSR